MSIWPLPGVTGTSLRAAIHAVHEAADNLPSLGTGPFDIIDGYLRWASESTEKLRLLLPAGELDRLVLTRRYWATLANPATNGVVVVAVNEEVRARQRELAAALEDLDRQLAVWTPVPTSGPVSYVVPDTNVLLHSEQLLPDIDWHGALSRTVRTLDNLRIVVPLIVIDELDDAKRDKIRTRARQTLKLLYEWFQSGVDGPRLLRQASASTADIAVQVLLDPPRHSRLQRTDDELVDRAAALQSFVGLPVDFVSYDTGAVLRATAAGLRAHRLEHKA